MCFSAWQILSKIFGKVRKQSFTSRVLKGPGLIQDLSILDFLLRPNLKKKTALGNDTIALNVVVDIYILRMDISE